MYEVNLMSILKVHLSRILMVLLLMITIVNLNSRILTTSVVRAAPPTSGDWEIESDTHVLDENYNLNGSIVIKSGVNLTLENSKIV